MPFQLEAASLLKALVEFYISSFMSIDLKIKKDGNLKFFFLKISTEMRKF